MQVYYDRDADLGVLKGKKVAVLGYGSQGHAHANNLRDSGVEVVVGLRRDSSSWPKAEAAGLKVAETADAAAAADIVMILLPDELQGDAYEKEIKPGLKNGNYLAFGHGFNIHFKRVVPPAGVNVFMVAPKGPGHLVRSEYQKGRGVPCLLAVHQDPLGKAADRVSKKDELEVWARPLADGSLAVGLFNRDEMDMKVGVTWAELGLKGKQRVRDLWRQKDVGIVDREFSATVPRHGTLFLKLTAQ